MKRKWLVGLLAAIVAISMLIPIEAFAGTTTAKTPDTLGLTTTKWQKSFGTGWNNAPTPPALIDGNIYVGAYNKVYKLNKNTGAVIKASESFSSTVGYAMMPVIGDGNGYVYLTTAKSQIIKLRESDMKIIWKSKESFGTQNVCPLKYYNGRIYGGTWGDEDGYFYCIDASTGKTIWKMTGKDGFYWAGAALVNGRIVFGGEGETLYSVSATANNKSTMDTQSIEVSGAVRCVPAVDGNSVYITTGDPTNVMGSSSGSGTLYKIVVGSDGKLTKSQEYTNLGASKNNPVISGSYVFAGNDNGKITVFNKETLAKVNQVTAPAAVKGEMVISTGNEGKVCVYATYNTRPGGIYYVELSSDCSTVSNKGTTFVPSHSQYCISPITVDDSTGILYYKNDSGYIMAVKGGLGKTKLATTAGSKRIALKWNKVNGATGYCVYRATTKNGTYNKIKTTSSLKWTNTGLKKSKTYYYRVKAYKTVNNSNVFGSWSNISYKRVK